MSEILIPNPSVHDVVSYKIFIEDEAIDSTIELLSIVISKEINRVPTAKIVIRDGDPAIRTFDQSNSQLFIPGRKIKIDIGRDGENVQTFAGIIVRHALKLRENGEGELQVQLPLLFHVVHFH